MRVSLRWRILLLAIFGPAVLGTATLYIVNRNVARHVNSSSIHESLEHSQAVFESMLRVRSRALRGGAHLIARDPRFFSLLMLRPTQRDSRFLATVRGMAKDFSRMAETDLFEVVDRQGRMLASVGRAASSRASRDSLVRIALKGNSVEALVAIAKAHYQVALTPVFAGGEIVGALLIGVQIGPGLARELRSQMRCEVTFLSGNVITSTSLGDRRDREALVRVVERLNRDPAVDPVRLPVLKVRTPTATYLTLVRRIPTSAPESKHCYVLQRAFDPETSFLALMRRDMLVLATLALLVALLSGLTFSRQILRPLQALVRGAREMERGNYDHPLEITRRDEIGYLGDRFVAMRQRQRVYLARLEQAAQLKSHFLSVASHELRTPISVLSGYRDILESGDIGPVTAQQRKALEAMGSHLSRLTRVADDAAHFARAKSNHLVLHFEPHDIEPIVRWAVAQASAMGRDRKVDIEVVCDPTSRPVEADADNLRDALVHLLTNGIRFTPDGGRIEVHAFQEEDHLHISVKDSGTGIATDRLEALLGEGPLPGETNSYRSATGLEFDSRGLGLGLYVARAVVEAHGGVIHAESKLGEGSSFAIVIPMTQGGQMAAAA